MHKLLALVFYLANLLLLIFGTVVVLLAAYMAYFPDARQQLIQLSDREIAYLNLQVYQYVLYGIAGVASYAAFIGFFGCCSICCRSLFLLAIFFLTLGALVVVEVGAAGFLLIYKSFVEDQFVQTWYQELIVNRMNIGSSVYLEMIQLQQNWNCCGARGCGDYQPYALTCPPCLNNVTMTGCAYMAFGSFVGYMMRIFWLAMGLLLTQIGALVATRYIARDIRQTRAEVRLAAAATAAKNDTAKNETAVENAPPPPVAETAVGMMAAGAVAAEMANHIDQQPQQDPPYDPPYDGHQLIQEEPIQEEPIPEEPEEEHDQGEQSEQLAQDGPEEENPDEPVEESGPIEESQPVEEEHHDADPRPTEETE